MMENYLHILSLLACFSIVAIASRQIGQMFIKGELPLISGFLFTGIIAGPFALNLISLEATEKLRFIDETALAFIAFAAGSELYLQELKSRFKSIAMVTTGLVLSTYAICSMTVFVLSDFIPFMSEMPVPGRVAVSILAGSILVARSPSSAIAIVNELRAKGPFTQTVLGVTVITDVVVITLFAMSSSMADGFLTGLGFDMGFIVLLSAEMSISVAMGYLLGKTLEFVLSCRINNKLKAVGIVLAGYSIFFLSAKIRFCSSCYLPFEIMLEPLLVCMIGSFMVTNYTAFRKDFVKIVHEIGPPIYVAFFTLTGASLMLDVLVKTWPIALVLFFVRCLSIFAGSFAGGIMAGDPMNHNRISWMAYITQAGVSLGLAKGVAGKFPDWGVYFATVMIAIIVLNQIVGPPLFKKAFKLAGEARQRADAFEFDGVRDVIIFGLESQSLALARLLRSHDWSVRIATEKQMEDDMPDADVCIFPISGWTLDEMRRLSAGQASAIVTMLSDEENYRICEMAYEHFGTENIVVRLNDRKNMERFRELGALIVDPGTAIVSLLADFVRSPSAASLLLGMEKNQDVVEVEVKNPNLHGISLRDLRLPFDTVVISIHRRGQMLISHGYTQLEVGDMVTIVGSLKSLEEIALRFDTNREHALVHLVEKVTAPELASRSFETEVTQIIRADDSTPKDRFDRFVEEGIVIDIPNGVEVDAFFKIAADAMSPALNMASEDLYELFMAREKESSTAISPGLAIPHIIIGGEHKFSILLARCREGIRFSESNPMVHAVFVMVGTRDERNFHLQALSAIAQIAQDPHFERKWLRARNRKALRDVIVYANRKRHV